MHHYTIWHDFVEHAVGYEVIPRLTRASLIVQFMYITVCLTAFALYAVAMGVANLVNSPNFTFSSVSFRLCRHCVTK